MTTTITDVQEASGHWYECGKCGHVETARNLPEMITARHRHYRDMHPDHWYKL